MNEGPAFFDLIGHLNLTIWPFQIFGETSKCLNFYGGYLAYTTLHFIHYVSYFLHIKFTMNDCYKKRVKNTQDIDSGSFRVRAPSPLVVGVFLKNDE